MRLIFCIVVFVGFPIVLCSVVLGIFFVRNTDLQPSRRGYFCFYPILMLYFSVKFRLFNGFFSNWFCI